MKKLIVGIAAFLCLSLPLTGCSSSEGKMELGQYKGVGVSTSAEVTDMEIEAAINNVLDSNATTEEVTGRSVQAGDIVNIDYEGLKDGVAFAGGTAEGFDLEIGSGRFIPGFEDGLIGAAIGEKRAVDLTFPEDYSTAELAGQPVVFNVTVNSIQKKIIPELTDALVQEVSDCQTVEEFREFARTTLTEQKQNARKSEAWDAITTNTKITEYPQKELEKNEQILQKNYTSQAQSQGMTLEEFLTANSVTKVDFDAQLQDTAKQIVTQEMIAKAIAKAENIEVTDEEYASDVTAYLEITGLNTVEEMETQYGKETLRMYLLQDKVLDFVSAAAVDKTAK